MKKYKSYSIVDLPWISNIPSHWKVAKNRQILQEVNRKTETGTEDLLMVSQYTGITKKSHNSSTGMRMAESQVGYKLVKTNDIVMNIMLAWNGSTGASRYNGIVSPAYSVFRCSNNINPWYIHYLFRTPLLTSYFKAYSTGIIESRLRLYPNVLLRLYSIVPPRSEQDQIVRYLDWQVSKVNKLIAVKKKKLIFLREAIDREFLNVSSQNCKRVKIRRFYTLDEDFFTPNPEERYRKAGMYNRGRGIFLRDECLGEELGDSKFQHIHSGRLMLSGQFAWEDAVYITQEKDESGIASHRYYLLKPIGGVPVEYLFAYFLSSDGFFNLQQCSHGSAGRNRPLNIGEVLNLDIPIPFEFKACEKLISLIRNFMAFQINEKTQEATLQELKIKLISDVVTGQIDVRGIEIPEYEYMEEESNEEPNNIEGVGEETEEQEDE